MIDIAALRHDLRTLIYISDGTFASDKLARILQAIPALLAELDASNAEYAKLRDAALAAYRALPSNGTDDEAWASLYDVLGPDGAPQDGGVTDPHETSGPPTTDHYPECIARSPLACICDVIGDRIRSGAERTPPITEDQQRGFDTLVRWTNMHHMTPSPEGMARIDNGHTVPDVLDAECARLVAHECGWQTQRHLEKLEPEVKP